MQHIHIYIWRETDRERDREATNLLFFIYRDVDLPVSVCSFYPSTYTSETREVRCDFLFDIRVMVRMWVETRHVCFQNLRSMQMLAQL